jgi:hypothetical protein
VSGQAVYLQSQLPHGRRAALAWSNLSPNCTPPARVEALQEKKNSAVYRLAHVGLRGENVIAKWVRARPCAIERTIYDNILARLETRSLRCFGDEPDDTVGFHWIFFEEAEGIEFDPIEPSHRAIAAAWLAGLHSTAHDLAAAMAESGRLPQVGPAQCTSRIAGAKDRIAGFIGNPALADEDRAVLAEVIGQCESLNGWCDSLDRHYRRFAPTLVHGDFVAKNLRICIENGQAQLLVFDWEMAGFGPPATDLAECDDLAAYHASLNGTFRTQTLADVQRLALIGKALRWAAAIDWASWGLEGPWVRKPMRNLRCYCHDMRELASALGQAGLVS